MFRKKLAVIALGLIFSISGCGGGGDSESSTDITDTTDNQIPDILSHVKTYEIPSKYSEGNYILDQDMIILIGGEKGLPIGASFDGHPAFSNQIHTIDLINESQKDYSISVETGHTHEGGTVADGIGNQSLIRKTGDQQYLIYGGFQYVLNTFILNTNLESIEKYETGLSITDDTGLNTTPFFANNQASAIFSNGNHAFFGFNNGLYGADAIALFRNDTLSYETLETKLTMARSNVDAYKMNDERVLLVGGWDGSATVVADSATRRVEIFDPTNNSIERVEDFPEPKGSGQHRSVDIVSDEKVCVENSTRNGYFEFDVINKKWSSGCTLASSDNTLVSSDGIPLWLLPNNYDGQYVGELSNGQLVYIDNNYSENIVFDEDCLCNLSSNPTTSIHVFSTN